MLPAVKRTDRMTAAANQVADAAESKDTTSPRQSEEANLSLLNMQVFWSYHVPVLPVKFLLHLGS